MIQAIEIPIELLEPNVGQIEGLPANPRYIDEDKYEALVRSLEEDPDLLELRELIVIPFSTKFIVLAGNMRLRGGKQIGFTSMPCKVIPADTDIDKLKRIVIKDNGSYGSHDFDALANEWNDINLPDWGVDMPYSYNEQALIESAWEQEQEEEGSGPSGRIQVVVVFKDTEDLQEFSKLIGQSVTERTKFVYFPAV